jgi:hypothetical protein
MKEKQINLINRLIQCSHKVAHLKELQEQKTKAMQELANDARKTGVSQSHRIASLGVTVIDFGDVVNEIARISKQLPKTPIPSPDEKGRAQ